jgi:purine nucleosidase
MADATAQPLVFIHDAAIDDFVATLVLQAMPEVDLKGVVIVNADCVPQPGIAVASQVNQFMGRPDLPLGLSAARGWNPFPWEYRQDCIALSKIPALQPFASTVPQTPPSGDDMLIGLLETAVASGEPLTVLITTGFTTLTTALEARPELAAGVGQVVWMGGALNVPGNLDPKTVGPEVANPHAEWNVFWDPFAADAALARLQKVAVFPLDITDKEPVAAAFLARLKAQGPQHSFSQFAWEAYGLTAGEPYYDMWNVVATVWLAAPQLYGAPQKTALQVQAWGFDQGWMTAAPAVSGRPQHDVYLRLADRHGFYEYVARQLASSA